jgi:ketosteroid isomerase-like protein
MRPWTPLGLCLALACQPAAAPMLSEADRQAIEAASDAFVQAGNGKDWAGWASAYAEDAVMMPPNTAALQGRAAIQAWGEAFPAFTDFRLHRLIVDGQGDVAFVHGAYSIMVTGAPAADTGKYIEIWRRQADGSRKIARDIFNSDLPLPAPPPPARPQ